MPPDRDDEELAAVREPVDAGEPSGAPAPDGDRELLRRIREAARSASDDPVPLVDPPPRVWDGIADALDLGRPGGDVAAAAPVPLAPRRRRTWIGAAAAAIVVVAVIGIGLAVSRSDSSGTVLASVELDAVGADPAATGSAELIEDEGGSLHIQLEVDGTAPDDAFLEVWLLDAAVSRLISLGPLAADADFELPPGIDIATFPVVDVSVEPIDGDPTHSGDSLLRGELRI